MLVSGIKSRPEYHGLTIDPYAKRRLFVLGGEGALALLEKPELKDAHFRAKAEILYVPQGSDHAATLRAVGTAGYWEAPTIPTLLVRLQVILSTAHMGLRLYAAGTEGFIGQVMQVGADAGINFNSIRTEHRGSLARRVSCVHCKGITENVTTSPAVCSHCGLTLLVRDHYSRRIGAFQGVCINAEVPAEIPPVEELFK
ncbi:MAG TPA: dimethylamine monooxygenase subunit DmmA family protein [Dongiaceae bacterium]|nr:dimethylamine monooxygenase subunit DmmA family protein [Dongiaceae bacterium]